MMARNEDIITIDGPSGVGKSTVARRLAERLGYLYLDTGAMYRTVTLAAAEAGIPLDPIDENEVDVLLKGLRLELDREGIIRLDGEPVEPRIREEVITRNVSAVSALPAVRSQLVVLQRKFAERGRVVVEGRDTGSVVFPQARFKFYLDADISERVRRRSRELRERGYTPAEDNVKQEILVRDKSDRERTAGPLTQSTDMFYLDTTRMRVGEAVAVMEAFVTKRRGS